MKSLRSFFHYSFLVLSIVWVVVSCANPGTPDGGPYDETPPHVRGSMREYGKKGFHGNKNEILLDEMV